jgi:hypothetical protein
MALTAEGVGQKAKRMVQSAKPEGCDTSYALCAMHRPACRNRYTDIDICKSNCNNDMRGSNHDLWLQHKRVQELLTD